MSLSSNAPGDPVAEGEKLFSAAAETAGPRLTELARSRDIDYINERDHLQPTFRQALKDTVKDERPRPSVSFDLNHGLGAVLAPPRQVRRRAGMGTKRDGLRRAESRQRRRRTVCLRLGRNQGRVLLAAQRRCGGVTHRGGTRPSLANALPRAGAIRRRRMGDFRPAPTLRAGLHEVGEGPLQARSRASRSQDPRWQSLRVSHSGQALAARCRPCRASRRRMAGLGALPAGVSLGCEEQDTMSFLDAAEQLLAESDPRSRCTIERSPPEPSIRGW